MGLILIVPTVKNGETSARTQRNIKLQRHDDFSYDKQLSCWEIAKHATLMLL